MYQLTPFGALATCSKIYSNWLKNQIFFGILCDKHVLYFWFYTPPPRVFAIATRSFSFVSFFFCWVMWGIHSPIPRLRGIIILLTYCSWNFLNQFLGNSDRMFGFSFNGMKKNVHWFSLALHFRQIGTYYNVTSKRRGFSAEFQVEIRKILCEGVNTPIIVHFNKIFSAFFLLNHFYTKEIRWCRKQKKYFCTKPKAENVQHW